jgi:hypothetical protein
MKRAASHFVIGSSRLGQSIQHGVIVETSSSDDEGRAAKDDATFLVTPLSALYHTLTTMASAV